VLVGDGMNSSTRVPGARDLWVSAVLSYHAKNLMMLPFMSPVLPAFVGAESRRVWLLGAQVHP
jgi:hypothetical protein